MVGFEEVFEALWGYRPFPWQVMLAERVVEQGWPRAIDLPTAAGKTACLDIAIYALANQADLPLVERTAPRRTWFVVDRRIIVDEAFERARRIAEKLNQAHTGPLKELADRLRKVSGTQRALAVGRLRGGILHDDGWARIPSQPAIITSTVDQVGSQILFRGYGYNLRRASMMAGLAANDSLIILDEAHCARPFMQTLDAVSRYRGTGWAEEPIRTPFSCVVMSATLADVVDSRSVFPGALRDQALDDPELKKRFRTSKPAELCVVSQTKKEEKEEKEKGQKEDPLVAEAVERARWFVTEEGKRRVAVMVNRVRTATEVANRLRTALAHEVVTILFTGRIRPFDRDLLVEHWSKYLRARNPEDPELPIVVVATQCLEVGADFSFDALITECASLDALRQRFGRLARMGAEHPAPAAILVRRSDVAPKRTDPIYGPAVAKTWEWLNSAATPQGKKSFVIDMGVEALEKLVAAEAESLELLPPRSDAAVLFPAHLDLLCQTSPPPHPEPNISLFLHGRSGAPEVSVVWRADLASGYQDQWIEAVAMCPPVSGEMLQVPLWRALRWLAAQSGVDDGPDIEGIPGEDEVSVKEQIRACVIWRGRDRSTVARNLSDIAPGDVLVVPEAYGIDQLGQALRERALGSNGLDIWESACEAAGHPPAVRINQAVLGPWLDCPPLKDLVALASAPDIDRSSIAEAVEAVLGYACTSEEDPSPPPEWWLDLLERAAHGRIEQHPTGGIVITSRRPTTKPAAETDVFADDDDLTSIADHEISLEEHSKLVSRTARKMASLCLPDRFQEPMALAALWHDAGKIDPRFQILLHRGDEIAAYSASAPLAKSSRMTVSAARRRAIREASGLPEGFRHEMLSLDLAKRFLKIPEDRDVFDLVLHLIASHHGYARPFAPVAVDRDPPHIDGALAGTSLKLSAEERASIAPAHRADSGIAERFWRLTRRYGWWGLAYLETILRLSDWYASAFTIQSEE